MIQPILCPVCGKPAVDSTATPFCCDRCRKIDFFRWWDGRYAITEPLSDDVAATLMDPEAEDYRVDREDW